MIGAEPEQRVSSTDAWEDVPAGFVDVADAVAAEILVGGVTSQRIAAVTRELATEGGLRLGETSLLLYRLVVRDPLFQTVEPAAAVDAQLRSLLAFAQASHASLWLRDSAAIPACAGAVGIARSKRVVRAAARHVLEGTADAGVSAVRSLPVWSDDGLVAALVFETRRGKVRSGLALASETATALGPILERRRLLEDTVRSAAQLLKAVDRRLAQIGFDLHDGPLQRLSLLEGELTVLNGQLKRLVPDEVGRRLVEQKIAGLVEIVREVEHELRSVSRSAGSSGRAPLAQELEREAKRLRHRGIEVNVDIEGNLDQTAPAQRLVMYRVVEEALANIRKHSRARTAHITVRRDASLLSLTIEDDGKGFDVRRAQRRAERDGRLGLVSMTERVRLMGGHLEISSKPGGPTVIVATLPVWELPRGLAGTSPSADAVA